MVSLRSFVDRSNLQEQLQDKLSEMVAEGKSLKGEETKNVITSCIQAALENYIVEIYLKESEFESPEDIQQTIEAITYHLSPESKAAIVSECSDSEAYRLGRTFYSMSKKMLPC